MYIQQLYKKNDKVSLNKFYHLYGSIEELVTIEKYVQDRSKCCADI